MSERQALDAADALEAHARKLYPDDLYLQQQWLRGVRLVRTTARGWLLDPPHIAGLDEPVHGARWRVAPPR